MVEGCPLGGEVSRGIAAAGMVATVVVGVTVTVEAAATVAAPVVASAAGRVEIDRQTGHWGNRTWFVVGEVCKVGGAIPPLRMDRMYAGYTLDVTD